MVLDTQVIVVGAGPVGLMLAGELRLGSAEVIVVERLACPADESRASTLHARTMELLDARGLLEAFGPLPVEPRGHFGGVGLDLTLDSPYPGQWKVPQSRTEELLAQWAAGLGADIRRGHTMRALSVRSGHVEIEADGPRGAVRLRSLYVVACDGEHSTVRHLTGADFPGHDAGRRILRADVAGIDIPNRRFERLAGGLAVAAGRADGVTRVMVHEWDGPVAGEPDFAEVVDTWQRVTGEDVSGGTPLWVNGFDDACRQVGSYRDGRVLFAGDAAHRQLPVGGQALNLGLQDAMNLGWKLAAEVGGRAPAGLLDSYHTERHAVGARTLSNIEAQAQLLFGGPDVEAARTVVGELIEHEEVRAHLAGMISGLDVRYDVGDGDHPLLGVRLPPTQLTTADGSVTTAELLREGKGVLVLFATFADDPAKTWADRVITVRAGLEPAGPLTDTGAVLVRPDGYIVHIGPNRAALVTALRRWFGEPAGSLPRQATTNTKRSQHMSKLEGRTALVTGSSRGMGRAIAIRLAREGALVAVHYTKNADAADQVVDRIERDGGRAFTVQAELGVGGGVHELFLCLELGLKERTGSADLNILVNNAGVMGEVAAADTTPEEFDRLFAVNAKAPFFVIQRALKNMPDGGRIVNISSGLTRFANPEEIAYAMSKGAVEQLALHYAKLLGPRRITVNSVAPGITRNDNPVFGMPAVVEQMAQLSTFNRVGEPEDVADVVAFLASDDARWVTGAFLDATGGTLLG